MNKLRVLLGFAIILLSGLLYRQAAQASHEEAVKACIQKFEQIRLESATTKSVKLFPFVQNYQQLGYRDSKGKVIIPAQFTSARSFSQERAVVADRNWFKGFIDPKGKVVIPYQFVWVSDFFNGIAVFSGTKTDRTVNGFIDRNGNVLLQFRDATPFEEFIGFRNGRAQIYVHSSNMPLGWIPAPGNPVRKATGYVDCTGKITLEDWK